MNTSTHPAQSSLSRVWLLSKIGFFSTLRSLLYFYAFVAIGFIGFPLLIHMITSGNILEAFQEVTETYRYGGLSSIFVTASTFYLLSWLNKLVHLPTPGAYTQIPATAGEKLASIGLLMVGYLALAMVISTVLTCLFTLGQGISFGGEWNVLFGLLSDVPARWLGLLILASVFPFLVVALCMIHFKKPGVGILVAMVFFFLLINLMYVGVTELAENEALAEQLKELSEQTWGYLLTGFFLVLDAVLVFVLHWRLKTLQLK